MSAADTPYIHDAPVTVTVASGLLQAAKSRKMLKVANTSTTVGQVVWLNCLGAAAVVGVGIPIGPGVVWTPEVPPSGAINAISEAGSPEVAVTWG